MSESKLFAHPVSEVDAVDHSLRSENTKNLAIAPDTDTLVVTDEETSQSQTVDTEVRANDKEEKA